MSTKKRPQNWTAEEKMQAVITYDGMDETEQGLYLRGYGLYSVDIQRWREEMLRDAIESVETSEKKEVRPIWENDEAMMAQLSGLR